MRFFSVIRYRVFGVAAAIVLIVSANAIGAGPGQGVAMQESVAKGKELFRREWKFTPASVPDTEELFVDDPQPSREQFLRRVNEISVGDGLGPMHNATSCAACHEQGGAAGVDRNVMMLTVDPRSPAVAKLVAESNKRGMSLVGDAANLNEFDAFRSLFPGLIGPLGNLNVDIVIHERSALDGEAYAATRQALLDKVDGGVDPTWSDRTKRTSEAVASQPVIAGRTDSIDFYLSQRNPPPLFGLQMIDRVAVRRMRAVAKKQLIQSKGKITGRVSSGKFGWRAQAADLDTFVRGACAGELGLQVGSFGQAAMPMVASLEVAEAQDGDTTPVKEDKPGGGKTTEEKPKEQTPYVSFANDLTDEQVLHLTSFIRSLPAPKLEVDGHPLSEVREGRRIFDSVGCGACHVQDMMPARGIYSDLLLHDMGKWLQAPSPAPPAPTSPSIRLSSVVNLRGTVVRPRRGQEDDFDAYGFSGWLRSSVAAYYGVGNVSTTIPKPYPLKRPAKAQFPYGEVPSSKLVTESPAEATWDALQREWRTPPLWGVADSAPYLHDGRAKTIDEAIQWHGGEGDVSRKAYNRLPRAKRELLLSFLRGLRAPTAPKQIAKKQAPSSRLPESIGPPIADSRKSNADSAMEESELRDVFSSGYE